MMYPITMYGHPVLRKRGVDIEAGSDEVKALSEDMFETMYAAQGVGLAAPQIGRDIRMFIVAWDTVGKDGKTDVFKETFINPQIVAKSDEHIEREEGCLSIPGIREMVSRPEKIKIKFFDTDWKLHEKEYSDMLARIIQHEYDHIEGILFIDYLSSLKKRLLKKKLAQISKGDITVNYRFTAPLMR